MSRAYDNAADARFPSGRRNLIINGGMQVAQRGTSSTSAGYVSLDRWHVNQSGSSTTFSQETFTVGEEIGGSRYYARFAVSTGNDNSAIQQRIENITSVPGGEVITISFWAKGTNPGGGNVTVGYNQKFGSGGSSDVGAAIETITLTSDWTKYEITFTNPSYSGKTIGTGSYWQLGIGQGTDTSTDAWTLDITNVQVELGNVATPFEHRSYGEELALCQRYYYRAYVDSGRFWGVGNTDGANQAQIFVQFPVPMRTPPTALETTGTATDYSLRMASNDTSTSVPTMDSATFESAFLRFNNVGHGYGDNCVFGRSNADGAYLGFSGAEL